MANRTWLITGVSSGIGYEMTKQLLGQGETVIGTVRNTDKVRELREQYPDNFHCCILDVTNIPAVQETVKKAFAKYEKIDVIVSNAGYGLFGCVEELSDKEIDQIIATNLIGSIHLIKSALPYLRTQGSGRIIQISSYGGQVAFPANSMYNATKFGVEGFCEALAQEVEQFGIGVTIVEPGGARTDFHGSAKVTELMPEYEACHGYLDMLDPSKFQAPGDPAKMAVRIIESVDKKKAPLRMILGSQALATTIQRLEERIADYRTQIEIAASTDITEEK